MIVNDSFLVSSFAKNWLKPKWQIVKDLMKVKKVKDREWKLKVSSTFIYYHNHLHQANFQDLIIQEKISTPV